jgi:hypothetical protein
MSTPAMIAKIATGEIEDVITDDGKNAAAVALGRMGGKARAAGMSAKKRKEIAKKAAGKDAVRTRSQVVSLPGLGKRGSSRRSQGATQFAPSGAPLPSLS